MPFGIRLSKITVFILAVVTLLWTAGFLYMRKMSRLLEEELRVLEDEFRIRTVRKFSFTDPSELDEWEEKKFARNSTEYSLIEFDGRPCVRAYSDNSASALYLKEELSHRGGPFVRWDWKVLKFPERERKETITDRAEFDFAMQFYVVFHARSIFNARAIQYVWTETIPEGTFSDSPFTGNVKVLVLRTGNMGVWKTEERDIAADYLKLFGEELDRDVMAVSFMTDADSVGSTAEALITDIELGYMPLPGPHSPESPGADQRDD